MKEDKIKKRKRIKSKTIKLSLKILLVITLLIIYMYICNIIAIPNNIVLFEGETIGIKLSYGLSLVNQSKYNTILTSSNLNQTKINEAGVNNLTLNLLGTNIKKVNVDVIKKTKVIPLGTAIGMKLYTKGVLVVGMSEIENEKPYENSGIEAGDTIIKINNEEVEDTQNLIDKVNQSNGNNLEITYIKDDKTLETSITPVKTGNEYKLGLWVRDAAAGVGTLTFYEPTSNKFMALGHGIVDIDTEQIVDIASGELVTTRLLSIIKGQKDKPGAIQGTIDSCSKIGNIENNTNLGVYGTVSNKNNLEINNQEAIDVATRDEIQDGKATIICELENNKKQEYEIEIKKIYLNDNNDNKSMLIKITDQDLIDKTGGIIQGMSGAPIIQNGKFVGAVTNVLVSDPTIGYGIFGDMLIKQLRNVIN